MAYGEAKSFIWSRKRPSVMQLDGSHKNPSLLSLPAHNVHSNIPFNIITFMHLSSKYNEYCTTALSLQLYRVSQEECAILRENVPYVKLYRYDPKHLYPKLNGYGDNGQRKVWTSFISAFCTPHSCIASHPSQ